MNEANGVMYCPMIGAARSTEQGLEIEMVAGHELTHNELVQTFGFGICIGEPKTKGGMSDDGGMLFSKVIIKEFVVIKSLEALRV